jgi:hypothetical protein
MQVALNELIEILKAEQKIYERYLELLIEQQEHLIRNNLIGIKSSTDEINALAQQAMNLENGRRTVISRLSEAVNLDPENIDVSSLLEKFSGPGFDKLEQLKATILETNEKVTEQKTRNELLIDQSMSIIAQTMQFIHAATNPKAIYDDPTRLKGGTGNHGALISRMM